ncbi:TetR/AcrR family transcriptional regulator [Variovorax sp. YR216]|uniref:TetR/AcrR family transcriptional regulator n=1 Tax=Variovorax sp. YR216 TaxID=1882828 RepID=UPI00089514EC|nr:TetR/AcrR family transcriptional regulator [Variovorax sp. YR216]SEB15659.1 transcriptional regulator, TetR family [Variovorax sp. YR216]
MARAKTSSAASKTSTADGELELNRSALLEAAKLEFASHGLKGASLENVARAVGITRAMIYYYFGGREGLYLATLEEAYRGINLAEMALDVDKLDPEKAMRKLIDFRIDFYAQNPSFVALVAVENQLEGVFLRQTGIVRDRGTHNLARTRSVLERGQREGVFRKDVDPFELHQVMVSLGIFNVSNRHTFGLIFGRDLSSPAQLARTRKLATEVVLRYLAPARKTVQD